METEQELNKKLAEWATDEIEHFNNDTHRHYRFGSEWYQSSLKREPDFTQSLDACFKWLVPKLRKKHIYIDLNNDHPENRGKKIWWAGLREYGHLGVNFWETEETPALALCKAIEKLIDAKPELLKEV